MDWARLKKVLGMLGSAHDGERLSALTRAQGMLAEEHLTLADIVGKDPAAEQEIKALRARIVDLEEQAKKATAYWMGMIEVIEREKVVAKAPNPPSSSSPWGKLIERSAEEKKAQYAAAYGAAMTNESSLYDFLGAPDALDANAPQEKSKQKIPMKPGTADACPKLPESLIMLNVLLDYCSGVAGMRGTANFLESIQSYYNRNGLLTPNQRTAINRIYRESYDQAVANL